MIKLKSLINLREQAPVAPPMGSAPVPMQIPPSAAPSPEVDQPTPEPDIDATPSPEDPGEYDWTKDFRAFEDAKNKAEAQAKKKLLDKMNKQIVGKKITTNASRGYGQPKTDHTIDQVKKVSVEFWYKEWVVIVQDENDKKYFLTPGVNVKIEQGAGGEPGADDQAPTEPDAAQTGTPGEEQPNPEQPAVPGGADMGTGAAPNVGMGGAVPPVPDATSAVPPVPGAEVPGAVPQAAPVVPGQQPAVPEPEQPPVKKKKIQEKIIKHWNVGKDISFFLMEFMSPNLKEINFTSYIKSSKCVINESRTAEAYRVLLEIPENHLKQPVDIRDIKLAAKEKLFSSGNIDQRFSRGSIDVSKVGRVYVMDFVKQTEWKS